jgi:hypothetical protein
MELCTKEKAESKQMENEFTDNKSSYYGQVSPSASLIYNLHFHFTGKETAEAQQAAELESEPRMDADLTAMLLHGRIISSPKFVLQKLHGPQYNLKYTQGLICQGF